MPTTTETDFQTAFEKAAHFALRTVAEHGADTGVARMSGVFVALGRAIRAVEGDAGVSALVESIYRKSGESSVKGRPVLATIDGQRVAASR